MAIAGSFMMFHYMVCDRALLAKASKGAHE